ncbi:MAG: sigma-70 family RNA polymerase sigma factor [Planctomycetes bacterium]|nr:sigma-70 family RNA polymerase sigma factor [Planctomycetota bacterium]
MAEESETAQLLRKWHAGDRQALHVLIERDLAWIQERVHRRLGPLLRAKAETADFVQETVVEVLSYTPKFLLSSRSQFRALLARIVENLLRDEADRYTACRRSLHRERPLPPDSRLCLDASMDSAQRPSRQAERQEWEAWVRLGLELVEPEERQIILFRYWDGLPFARIAQRLGISEDAARMRFNRALARLSRQVHGMRGGKLGELLEGGSDS